MIRLAKIDENDIVNGDGICVSVWAQGCPHKCKGCHNPETWAFDKGIQYDENEIIKDILSKISKYNINRNLSFLGGEPLCEKNRNFFITLAREAKLTFPNIKIWCWTGYTLKELNLKWLENIDVLIDGKFIEEKKDISLPLRGSSNQRILKKGIDY